MNKNQKFLALACVIILSACSSTGVPTASSAPQESEMSQQATHETMSAQDTHVDYADNSAQLRESPKTADVTQKSGPTLTSSKVMLYSDYLGGVKEGKRADVAMGRVVRVETSAISSPVSLASGAVFTSGVETIVIDAVTGDVLSVRLAGRSTRATLR